MGILIKFTLRNIKEHKFRTFLIILSITLSVALFFGSFSISDSLTGLIMDNLKSYFGDAEIIIGAGERNETGLVKIKDLGELSDKFTYQIGSVETSGKFKNSKNVKQDVSIKGFDLSDLEKFNPVSYKDKGDIDTQFIGKSVIVGNAFAVENNLTVGDNVKIQSGEEFKIYKIAAIAEDKGFFKKSVFGGSDAVTMIAPVETIQKFYGTNNGYFMIYVKTVNQLDIDKNIEELKTVYKNDSVNKTVTKAEIDAQIKPIRLPFMFMLILVVIISIFIIYTSFKVIMLERLPMLGTFRSIGATKKMTNLLMLSESVIYGVIGSAIGTFLGTLLLKVLMGVMTMGMGGDSASSFPINNVILSLAFGIGLCFFSALVPIIKTTKVPVKEILLNIIEGTKKKKKNLRYIIGVITGVLAIVLPKVLNTGMIAALSGGIGIIFVIITMILFIPLLTDLLLMVTEKLFGILFGNIGILASKNLKGNKSTYDNVVLLTIGLTSIIAISVLGSSIEREMFSEFENSHYDVEGEVYGSTRTTLQRILTVPGIEELEQHTSSYYPFKYNGDTKFLTILEGVSSEKYFDMVTTDILNTDNDAEIFEDVLSGRKLILSTQVRDKYNLTLGQSIKLTTPAGDRDYKIIGFINSKKGNGNFGITSIQNLKYDFKRYDSIEFMIKTQPGVDVNQVVEGITEKVKKADYYNVTSLQDKKIKYANENGQIIMILSVFSYATALIGSVGVMNNFMVSFISRRKSLAVMTSVGMSKKQRKKMILIEAIAAGFIGGVFGVISGQIIVKMVENLLQIAELRLTMELTIGMALTGMIGGILVCIISSIGVIRRSGKLSVLEELKYE